MPWPRYRTHFAGKLIPLNAALFRRRQKRMAVSRKWDHCVQNNLCTHCFVYRNGMQERAHKQLAQKIRAALPAVPDQKGSLGDTQIGGLRDGRAIGHVARIHHAAVIARSEAAWQSRFAAPRLPPGSPRRQEGQTHASDRDDETCEIGAVGYGTAA